jgi:hypothetical protein
VKFCFYLFCFAAFEKQGIQSSNVCKYKSTLTKPEKYADIYGFLKFSCFYVVIDYFCFFINREEITKLLALAPYIKLLVSQPSIAIAFSPLPLPIT